MNRGKLIFITGGARSGKSSFAEKIAIESSREVTYIATAEPLDSEMKYRIQKHKDARPSHWKTYEEPCKVNQLIRCLGRDNRVIIMDCLTLLTSNLLLRKEDKVQDETWQKEILNQITDLAESAYKVRSKVIIVSNEVGMGLVPDNVLGRSFRDVLGKANYIFAGMADEVILMVSGIPLKIKGK